MKMPGNREASFTEKEEGTSENFEKRICLKGGGGSGREGLKQRLEIKKLSSRAPLLLRSQRKLTAMCRGRTQTQKTWRESGNERIRNTMEKLKIKKGPGLVPTSHTPNKLI